MEDTIQQEQQSQLREFRFYEEEFPNEGDLVMCEIKDVTEYATIAMLLEYANREGIIISSEYTRQANRSGMTKVRKIGKQEICKVLRVDAENGYIDLSRKQVRKEDEEAVNQIFAKNKTIQAIIRGVSQATSEEVAALYERIVWPLQKKHTHALDAFKEALNDFEKAFEGITMSDPVKKKLKDEIARRLSSSEVKIAAYFEVNCFTREGIDAIKESLRAAEAMSTNDTKLSVTLVSPPIYMVNTVAKLNQRKAIETVNAGLDAVEKAIKARGGQYKLNKPPQILNKDQDAMEDMLHKQEDDGGEDQAQFEDEEDQQD